MRGGFVLYSEGLLGHGNDRGGLVFALVYVLLSGAREGFEWGAIRGGGMIFRG